MFKISSLLVFVSIIYCQKYYSNSTSNTCHPLANNICESENNFDEYELFEKTKFQKKKLIFIFSYIGSGHLNPLFGLTKELVAKYDIKVFADKLYKEKIEKIGAKFSPYADDLFLKPKPINDPIQDYTPKFINNLLKGSINEIPNLIQQIQEEKPDLIIYDFYMIVARFVISILEKNYKNTLNFKMPKFLCFYPSFAIKLGVYPEKQDVLKNELSQKWWKIESPSIIYHQRVLDSKFGINNQEFLSNVEKSNHINLVFVFPELHPKVDKYGTNFKFVGSMTSENVRKKEVVNEKLNELLQEFDQFSSVNYSIRFESKTKLIYVSLGSVFNNNVFLFEKIIEAIGLIKKEESSTRVKCVVACGKESYEVFQLKIKNENYVLPEDVILIEFAPQIDVLERANIFVSHCGMNSVNEAINYGVPLVCIPIYNDQFHVSDRIDNDLNLGIKMDTMKFTPEQLKSTILKIFSEKDYFERMFNFSKISRSYNGVLASMQTIDELVNS